MTQDNRAIGQAFLEHDGVKGMKWGRRKGVTVTPSSDHKEAHAINAKSRKEMSNSDLKKVNERLQLERKHSELNPSRITAGQKKVATILAIGGTATAVYNLANSPAAKAGLSVMKTAIAKSLAGNGKHVLGGAVSVTKTAARHL